MAFISLRQLCRVLCKTRFEVFGCAGRAQRIQPIALEVMAKRYH